ncbi:MAG: helix-turn-helix domain-containing protein [PVC group bacterium]|nr:helix-turn-helix domain-containing protein [PVC group bacterium]
MEEIFDLERDIVNILKGVRSLRRCEIVRRTGFARTTIYDYLKRLEEKGIVERYTYNHHRIGRSHVFWRFVEQ